MKQTTERAMIICILSFLLRGITTMVVLLFGMSQGIETLMAIGFVVNVASIIYILTNIKNGH